MQKNERHLHSSEETTVKSLENEDKKVDNTEEISLTRSVSIVELIQIETSISNGFMGFQFREIFSKWNETL